MAVANSRQNTEHNKEGHSQQAICMMPEPEMQLPYLLHLLAHHPEHDADADDDDDDDADGGEQGRMLQVTQPCLDLFLDSVCTGEASPQYELLIKLLICVKCASDRMAQTSCKVHRVADVAYSLIVERTKRNWEITPVAESISLPARLFKAMEYTIEDQPLKVVELLRSPPPVAQSRSTASDSESSAKDVSDFLESNYLLPQPPRR